MKNLSRLMLICLTSASLIASAQGPGDAAKKVEQRMQDLRENINSFIGEITSEFNATKTNTATVFLIAPTLYLRSPQRSLVILVSSVLLLVLPTQESPALVLVALHHSILIQRSLQAVLPLIRVF